jgi:hypothetical protein
MLIAGFGIIGGILRAIEQRRRRPMGAPVERRRRGQRPGGSAI